MGRHFSEVRCSSRWFIFGSLLPLSHLFFWQWPGCLGIKDATLQHFFLKLWLDLVQICAWKERGLFELQLRWMCWYLWASVLIGTRWSLWFLKEATWVSHLLTSPVPSKEGRKLVSFQKGWPTLPACPGLRAFSGCGKALGKEGPVGHSVPVSYQIL